MKSLAFAVALCCTVPAWGAIAFVPASHTICSQTGSSGAACTLPAPTAVGDMVIAGLTWTSNTDSINDVEGSAPSSFFFPYSQICNPAGTCSAILICRDCSALTTVTPHFAGQTSYNLSVEEYEGVTAIGVTQAITGTGTNPGVTVTTGDANDWIAAITSSAGAVAPTAGTGNLRDASSSGNGVAGAACDNTAATAGSLSCTATIPSGAWSAVGVELRTTYPTTYIWPDCDTTHPCVIHEKDTVALGTGTDTLTGPFKITVPPTLPGNLMKLTISHPSAATISSISDDQSNTWTAGASTTDTGNGETTEVRYVCGAATGTSVVSVAFSNAIVDGDVTQFSYDEVSGIAASACGDGNSGSSGGQGVLNPGPIATSSSGDLIFTFGICTSLATENGNQAGVVMPDDNSAKIAENDFDQFMSMVELQASAGPLNPTIYANAQDVNNRAGLTWNIVSQAFKPSSGAGTQPSGIHVVTDQHFINWEVLGWNPLPSNGNAVVFSTSNPSSGWGMTNLADNYGTTYTRTAFVDPAVDPQQFFVCLGANISARDRIFSYTPDVIQTHVEIYTLAGALNATGAGCVGTTVNHAVGTQGPTLDDNIVGDPVITPTINAGNNSAIFTTSYVGTGPPTGMCISGGVTPPTCTGQSAGVIFNSIYATGMTDQSSWSTGDPYAFFYTNSTTSRSMDYLMANGTSGTALYGAAIEIFGGSGATGPATITPAVTVSPSSTSITVLQPLSVTAVVNGGGANPTPTGAVTLTGGGYTSAATALSGGVATFNIAAGSLATGSDTLTVTYTPDASSAATYSSASGATSVTVTPPATTTPTVTVTPSLSSIISTQALSVSVIVNGAGASPTPSGAVTLTSSGYTSAAATLSGGTASFTIPAGSLVTGSDTLTVTYTPDASGSTTYNSASGSALVTVTTASKVTPTVTVTPSPSTVTTTQALSVSVAVGGGSGNPTATGTVTLTGGGYTSPATALSGGLATINIPAGSLATGSDTLTVTYTPDPSSAATYNSSSGSAPVTVTIPAKTTPTVTVTPSSSTITTTQALSVTVAVSGGSGNPAPTGSVTLSSGGYSSAAATLSGGAATFNIPAGSLATGSDTLTVTYTPDTSSANTYNSATGSASVTVSTPAKTTPTVTVTPSSSNITTTQALSVSVAVSGGNSTPTGSVTLTSGGYSSGAMTLSGGAAIFGIPAGTLATGSDPLTVTYAPDTSSSTTYNSASGLAFVTVTAPAKTTPTVTVTPSSSIISTTQGLSVSVAVSGGSSNATPTGSVTLTSGGYSSPAITLSGGAAIFGIPAGSLATGSDMLTATYTPDTSSSTTYSSASGSASVTVTAPAKMTPTVIVIPSSSTITTTQALTAAVVVSAGVGNPTPTGSVTLTGGGYTSAATTLNGGDAIFAIPAGSLATGSDTLTVTYTPDASGASTYNGASGSIPVTVTQASLADFTLSNSGNIDISPGATTVNTSTITITPSGGFTGTVTLTCTVVTSLANPTAPPTCSVVPSSVNIVGTSAAAATLTVDTTAPTTGALTLPLERFFVPGGGLALAFLCFVGVPARRRNWWRPVLLLAAFTGVAGCGTSIPGNSGGTNGGTTAGVYSVIVTGTSGSLLDHTTVTVTVK